MAKQTIMENQDLGKILIIDDNEDLLFAAKMLLKKHAKEVTIEKDPRRIPFLINNNNYDVIPQSCRNFNHGIWRCGNGCSGTQRRCYRFYLEAMAK